MRASSSIAAGISSFRSSDSIFNRVLRIDQSRLYLTIFFSNFNSIDFIEIKVSRLWPESYSPLVFNVKSRFQSRCFIYRIPVLVGYFLRLILSKFHEWRLLNRIGILIWTRRIDESSSFTHFPDLFHQELIKKDYSRSQNQNPLLRNIPLRLE